MNGKLGSILKSPKTYWLGAIVGAVTYLLSWIITILGIAPKTIKIGNYFQATGALVDINVRQQLTSGGVANTIGLKMVQLLTAIPKWDWGDLITLVIGSIVLVIAGKWIYTIQFVPKNTRFKLALEMLYGAIAVVLVLTWIGKLGLFPPINLLLTLAVYYLIIAIIVNYLAKTQTIGKFIREG